jgi:hypothetical protein
MAELLVERKREFRAALRARRRRIEKVSGGPGEEEPIVALAKGCGNPVVDRDPDIKAQLCEQFVAICRAKADMRLQRKRAAARVTFARPLYQLPALHSPGQGTADGNRRAQVVGVQG